jgi:HK97 family phage prohead protease
MKQTDVRVFQVGQLELRNEGGYGRHIEGLAVPYGVWTDLGPFREMIAPGAFDAYLESGADVVYNYGHDRNAILGRRSSGTLGVRSDSDGVHVRLELPDTTQGRDLAVMIERGDITGHSIEFTTDVDEWESGGGQDSRTVKRGGLPGVALVGQPAYATTTAAMRSRQAWHKTEADRVLRSIDAARLQYAQALLRGHG